MEEVKPTQQMQPLKMRIIEIQTDGQNVVIVRDESASLVEFSGIIQAAMQQRAQQAARR